LAGVVGLLLTAEAVAFHLVSEEQAVAWAKLTRVQLGNYPWHVAGCAVALLALTVHCAVREIQRREAAHAQAMRDKEESYSKRGEAERALDSLAGKVVMVPNGPTLSVPSFLDFVYRERTAGFVDSDVRWFVNALVMPPFLPAAGVDLARAVRELMNALAGANLLEDAPGDGSRLNALGKLAAQIAQDRRAAVLGSRA
jgi:hypothetical protein